MRNLNRAVAKRQAIGKMDLSFGARECWRLLEGFPRGSCFPSHFYIAETMRKSPSSVCRYLRELKNLGYIEIVANYDTGFAGSRPRGQTSNRYAVLEQVDLVARARQIFEDWSAKQPR